MPLHLMAVLDQKANSSSGGLLDWAIRQNFLESGRRLLEAMGATDIFRFEVIQAATLQYISIDSATSPVVNVFIGVFDFRQDMARIIHTISDGTGDTLISASTALVILRPLRLGAGTTTETATLLGQTPSWTHNVPREVRELLQIVALPMNSPLRGPVRWDYRAVVK